MPISQAYLGAAKAPSGMKNFYFVHHGATDLNEKTAYLKDEKHWGVQGGGTDIGLNARGMHQARMAGNLLRAFPISKAFCSPLLRALQTLILANIRLSHFEVDGNLRERDFGKHEGGLGPLQMFEDKYPGCEDPEAFSLKVAQALSHTTTSDDVLLVSHGGVLRVIGALLGVDLTDEHTSNGRVLYFSIGGGSWTVQVYQSPVILISGATRGIGRAIAEDLMVHGYRVSLGARNVEDLEIAFGAENESLHYARFDAEDHHTMKTWVAAAAEKFGRIDGLVNNAGDGTPINLEEGIDYKLLQKQLNINSVAPLRMTELCLPYLIKARSGRVVNINSMSGQRVMNSFVGYNMTKHALGGLTKTTQHVGWDHGVRAVDVCPGFVATGMSAWTDSIGEKDMVQPGDIAKIVREALERPNRAFVPKIEVMCMKEATR